MSNQLIHKTRIGGTCFYTESLRSLVSRRIIDTTNSVLVVGGSVSDRNVLNSFGFKSVIISNLDDRIDEKDISPYTHAFEHADRLSFADKSYDVVIAANCIHHCRSPHVALIEALRVAKKGVFVLEGRLSQTAQIALAFGLSEDYELKAVKNHEFEYGGVDNTSIPNHVYRWTENEIYQIVQSYFPNGSRKLSFFISLMLAIIYNG